MCKETPNQAPKTDIKLSLTERQVNLWSGVNSLFSVADKQDLQVLLYVPYVLLW